MLKMMEEECILISMKEEVELSFVTVEYSKILHNSDQDCIFILFMLLRHQVASTFRMFYFISIKQPITWLYTEKYINLLWYYSTLLMLYLKLVIITQVV